VAKIRQSALAMPTVESVKQARKDFIDQEPRNLFYLVATELIGLVKKGMSKRVSVAQALAVLLQTWNVSFYRFRGGFHESDLTGIEDLLKEHLATLKGYECRQITSFEPGDEQGVGRIFGSFEKELGAVGAAKCLHLLVPAFSHCGTGLLPRRITSNLVLLAISSSCVLRKSNAES
jgi:hypothetical protein